MSFPNYSDMHESGIPWIGKIPIGWDVVQGRRLFVQKRDPSEPEDEQLSATQKYGVLPQSKFMELEDQKVTLALSGLDNFKHVQVDDFVISLRSFQGGIEHSAYSGCVSPAYTILRPNHSVHPPFWKYLMKSRGYIEALQSVTDGIRDGKNISYEQFGMVFVPDVPTDEQKSISSFLDAETSKIDALIAEQRRLIELMKEKRQAVISHAVTKGLHPNAPMKPSGIEWLGDVPAHWKIPRLCYYATIENGTTPSRDNPKFWSDGIVPWLSSGEVNQYRITEANECITQKALDECSLRLLPKGTIVTGMIGQGKTRGLAASLEIEATINQNLAAIVPNSHLKSDYLLYIFQSAYEYLREFGRGGNQAALNCEILSALRVPLPPSEEQTRICDFLGERLGAFNTLTAEAERGIELLRERRTALISAAVTGKIDVRQFANVEAA
jgi:type I restriction enzyme S subunit